MVVLGLRDAGNRYTTFPTANTSASSRFPAWELMWPILAMVLNHTNCIVDLSSQHHHDLQPIGRFLATATYDPNWDETAETPSPYQVFFRPAG